MSDTSFELVKELARIDTPTLSNAVEQLEVRNRIQGFTDLHLRCLTPQLGTMCGFAVTAQAVTMAPQAEGRGKSVSLFLKMCEALQDLPGPGIIVIQEAGPHSDFATHCGDVLSTLFQKFGGVGLVSDAGIRDLDEVAAMGFHLFARGLVVSHANFEIVRVQVPVTVCGLDIEPGDLLHGDLNGLIKIPEEGREKLAGLAAGITERESGLRDCVKDGASLDEIYKRFTH